MKIAYLANVRFPSERAHSTQIAHVCQAMSTNGAEVDLVVNKRVIGNDEVVNNLYNFDSKFSIKRIYSGVLNPKIKFTFYLSELFFSLQFLINFEVKSYDILYSRNEWIVWLLSLCVSKNKLVWESHEAKLNFPARQILKQDIKTVVISEGVFYAYINYGVPEENMLIAHDGIDKSFFEGEICQTEARSKLSVPAHAKICMYIGGFDEWKGVETFLSASKYLTDVLCVVIGGSEEQTAKFSVKYPNVMFLGSRPYAELAVNQQAADVLVIPNSATTKLSQMYTSPLKLFAHMTSSIPLVVSDIPSITNVTGRENVTLVIPDDVESLVQGVQNIFDNLEIKKLKAEKLISVARSYTWDERAISILDFISNK